MNQRAIRIAKPVLVTTVLAAVMWLNAGDLNPPVGPVAPTHKTLTEVEPRTAVNATNTPGDADSLFKITQPGSYYLTGNITGVVDKHGVEIVASGVTLDLNGFDLLGVAGSLDGVSDTVGVTNIAVVNGSVRSWGGVGVDLGSSGAINCRVEGVLASGNAGNGIRAGSGSTVTNCSAYLNTGNGIFAIFAFDGCTVSNCSAYQNTSSGISINGRSTVSNCSAYLNTVSGIITADSGSRVWNCSASFNSANGIHVGDSCTVADCTTAFNTLDGIRCSSACVVRGNTCASNGIGAGFGAGIHAAGGDNRIEGNNCINADRGIDVDGLGNFITRNTCSGNATNWDIVAGNVCLVVQGVSGAAILGNTGGVAPGSTDPNANFTY
jgi:hypothetical protein